MKHEEFLSELLQRTKRRLKLMELGAGAVTFLAFLVASVTLGVILDHAFALPKVARWAILLALDAGIAIALLAAVVFLLRRLNDVFVARLIERLDPSFRNTLVASIEARKLTDIPAGIREFIEEQAVAKATRVDPLLAVSPRRLVVASYALLLAFLFFFFYSFFTHKSVLVALERIWEPGADIPPATATQIVSVEPGTQAVLAKSGSSLPVVVKLRGVIPKRVTLQWSREQELWGSLDLTAAKDGRQWQTALVDLERDLFYSIQAGDARSPIYQLHVVPVPLVTSLQTHYRFPDYTGLAERVTYRGDVDALDGTVITVQAHTNTTLARAELLVNDVAVPATVRQPQPGEEPGDTVEGSFTVSRGGSYSIRLTDPFGFTNPDPVRYEVVCRYDQPPAVAILEPRGSIRTPAGQPLALTFEAKDDLGLASLRFRYKLPQEREERSEELPLLADVREVHNEVTVHLDRLGLEPGQTLACYLQALDTFPEQPHVGRSDTLVVAVPLPEELTEAYAQATAGGEEGEAAEKGAEQVAAAAAAPATPEAAAGNTQEPDGQEANLQEMLARDETVIDTIRQFLAEDAQAQAAAQPGGQPGAATQQGPATGQNATAGHNAAAGQAAQAAAQPNAGTTPAAGQSAAAGQANPQAGGAPPAGQPGQPQPPVTVWPTGEVGEPGQGPLTWPSEVATASVANGAAVQPATNPPASAPPTSSSSSGGTSHAGVPGAGGGQSGTQASQSGAAQAGQGSQPGQAQASGQQAPSGAAASSGTQGSQQPSASGAATTGTQAGQQASSQGSANGQTQGGQGSGQGQSPAGQAGAQPGSQSGSQASQSAGQPGAQAGAQSGSQGGAQPGGQAQAGAGAQSGSASSSAGGGSPNAPAGPQQGPAQGEPLNPAQTLQPGGGTGSQGGGSGGGTSGTQPPDLTIGAATPAPEGGQEKLEVVGQVIDQLYDRLLRNDINPKLLEQLNWNLQDLAAWVATYKAKLDQLPREKGDAGVLLGEGAAGLPAPEQRVIEMGKPPLDVKPTVGEGTPPISPDEVAQLLQGAKGTVSAEYRILLEDYYRALADTARR